MIIKISTIFARRIIPRVGSRILENERCREDVIYGIFLFFFRKNRPRRFFLDFFNATRNFFVVRFFFIFTTGTDNRL